MWWEKRYFWQGWGGGRGDRKASLHTTTYTFAAAELREWLESH